MYVDKVLSGIKAVQTLSRLNRAHPKKHDVFVLDFMNDTDTIEAAFADYYRTTILARGDRPEQAARPEGRPRRPPGLRRRRVDELVELYLGGADRDQLDPILDACVATYKEQLDEDGQVDFKGKAKAFTRTYGFLASILPYTNAEWEKLSIFLNFLVPKLPAPDGGGPRRRASSRRSTWTATGSRSRRRCKIQLPDEDAEIEPVPTSGGGAQPEPELDRLSNILETFNDQFGNIAWTDADRVQQAHHRGDPGAGRGRRGLPERAGRTPTSRTPASSTTRRSARVMTALLKDDTELFKQFSDNESFRRWLTDTVFGLTYTANRSAG